jgi:hypothetical protein
MAFTTTATTTYPLLKYSRSYPSANTIGTSVTDWQHFTNPVLRLILDVTKTEKSELHSVRLRVIWTIQNGGVITVNDNSEIVLASSRALSSILFSITEPYYTRVGVTGRRGSTCFFVSTTKTWCYYECPAQGCVQRYDSRNTISPPSWCNQYHCIYALLLFIVTPRGLIRREPLLCHRAFDVFRFLLHRRWRRMHSLTRFGAFVLARWA